jgi:hypothetical protein
MFGVEEAARHFNIDPRRYATRLDTVVFTEEMLHACRDTHILVAIFPLSIAQLHDRVPHLFDQREYRRVRGERFVKKLGREWADWWLVPKAPKRFLPRHATAEQRRIFDSDLFQFWYRYRTDWPTARVMVYTILGHFLATGERIFENPPALCVDHVGVSFDGRGSDNRGIEFWDHGESAFAYRPPGSLEEG